MSIAQTAAWWHEAVIYHVYLPSFRDSDGDGYGDLAGLTERLPYLSDELGVDALWVSPFYVSPWRDGGYDIADHTAVDPRFGDLAALDRLVEAVHARDMRLIVDYVPNHTSDRHPWFQASRSSRDDPKRDWYVWVDTPNNWVSEAGGSVWEHDEPTGQYYLHSHLKEQPDLNWRNPELRAAMLDVLRFWLDRGVDGFRVDVAHMLMKDPELRDNPPNPDGSLNPYDNQHPDFHTQLHVHDRRHPDLHGILRDVRELLDGYGDRIAIGEIEVMPWSDWAEYYGADLDELHLPLNFSLIETPWEASAVRAGLAQLETALPDGAWAVNNLGNHDRSRIATRYGAAQARVAAMLLLTARGTPLLYYGDELGMDDVDVPPELRQDGFSHVQDGPCRDPNRTPLPWDAAQPHAGFAPAEVERLWLPMGTEHGDVAAQLADPRSTFALYRRLLELRRRHAALRVGSIRLLDAGAPDCVLFERRAGAERLLVALNLSSDPRTVRLPGPATVLASTLADRGRSGRTLAGDLALRGDEGAVVEPTA